MGAERFQNSPSGRVIRVGHGEAAYAAFVPNPLPPALAFDLELTRVLSEADRSLGELAGLGRTMPNPNLLIRPFIHREAVLSSRIEGTQADMFPGMAPGMMLEAGWQSVADRINDWLLAASG